MSNPPHSTDRPALVIAIIGAIALGAYLLLLSGWRDPAVGDATQAPVSGEPEPTRLELSRELSPTGLGAAPTDEPAAPRRGWLTPLIAFGLPLALGFIWGAWNNRPRTAAAEAAGVRAGHQTVDATPVGAADNEDEEAARTFEDEEAAAPDPVDDTQPPAQVAPPEPAFEEVDEPSLEALHERLEAKNEVIAALEAIVRDNRDEWEQRERESGDLRARVAQLEAELQAVDQVMNDNAPAPVESTQTDLPPAEETEDLPAPQVMARR